MVTNDSSDTERKIVTILKVLSESSKPVGSTTIARELERFGIFLSERAVRYHLRITDERGYTRPEGHDGRMITPLGLEEYKMALAPDQVGSILEKLETLAFQTTFDPGKRTGLVPINTSILAKEDSRKAFNAMDEVFKAKICVSDLVAVAGEGEKLGSVLIPEGKIGIATLCSVTINAVLLRAGVPTAFRFGGVLEFRDSNPRRFTAIIEYHGSSLDPSEQYIRAKMTSVSQMVKTGSGKVLAVFRTIPGSARATVEEKLVVLNEAGIRGMCILGEISQQICQIHVGLNQAGMIQFGGLNPIAAAVEEGVEIDNIAESGLIEYERLQRFSDII